MGQVMVLSVGQALTPMSPELQKALLDAVHVIYPPIPKDEEVFMIPRYFELTAHTGYCGEELTECFMVQSEEELPALRDELMYDCAAEWAPDFTTEYEDYGYDCAEDFEEDWYAQMWCGVKEISREEYYAAMAV